MEPNPPHDPQTDVMLQAAQSLFGGHDPDELLRRFFALGRQVVSCDGMGLGLLLPSRRALRLQQVSDEGLLPQPGAALPLAGTSLGHTLAEGHRYISGNLSSGELRFPDEELCRSRGLASCVTFPLGSPGQWLGTLCVGFRSPGPPDEARVSILARLCETFSQALAQALEMDRLRRLADRERVLLEFAETGGRSRDLPQAFEALCSTLATVLPIDRAAIFRVEGDLVRSTAIHGILPDLSDEAPAFEWRGSHLEGAVTRREPYLYRLGTADYAHLDWLGRRGFQSTLGAPIVVLGTVYGVLAAAARGQDAYSPEDLELMVRAAQLLAVVVENGLDHQAGLNLASRERELQELRSSLGGLLDSEEIFRVMVAGLRKLIPFEWAVAYEQRADWMTLVANDAPPEAQEYLDRRFRMEDEPNAGYVDAMRAGRTVRRQRGVPGSETAASIQHGYGASLALPLMVRGRLVGLLSLVSTDPEAFPPHEHDLLQRAGHQFGLALQSARAFSDVQRLAQRERDLLEITNTLASYRDPQDVYPAMMAALQRLVDFDLTVTYSLDGDWMRPAVPTLLADGQPAVDMRWRESVAREAIETRRPTRHVLEELEASVRDRMVAAGLSVLAFVPVPGRERVLAVFAMVSHNPAGLTAADLLLVGRAAQQFGLALENARAHAENLHLAQRDRDLLELANALTQHRDPQEILQEMLPALGRLVRFDPSDMVALFDMEGELLRPVAVNLAPIRDSEIWRPFRWAGLPVGPLMASGSARRMAVEELWAPAADRLKVAGFRVTALVPLTVHGHSLGLFWLASRNEDAFSAGDLAVLSRVAQQFGLALEAGRGYMEIQQRGEKLEHENLYLKEELSEVAGFEEIIGVGPALARVRELVRKVARTDTVVLVRGESGTGKELVAEAVHRLSARADRPLIKVNCAALPESLISSELFGHEKGAFTGAFSQRLGRFEVARGGTIFLDEIAELSLDVQSNLLRVLQEGEFERVGSSTTQRTDARVITATNRNLEAAVAQGRFREDLFYRLNVFPIHVPPLRERPEDIVVLAYYFLHRHAHKLSKNVTRLSPDSEARMLAYSWPGNIRELQNVIERAVILSDGEELRVEPGVLLLPAPREAGDTAQAAAEAPEAAGSLLDAERRHILAALRRAGGRIAGPGGAADILGLKRTTLNSKIKKLGITKLDFLQ